MSTEIYSLPQPSLLESNKKSKEKIGQKAKKKRKYNDSDGSELPGPVMKQQPSSHPGPPHKTDTSLLQSVSVNDSPFYEQTSSLYLPLSPISYQYPESGLCAEHLSPLILTYFPPFNGVILSYCNVRLSADPGANSISDDSIPVLAKSVDEYAVSFVWVTADFLVFRPRRQNLMEGWVTLQNEGNLGLVFLNFFNVSIERRNLHKKWVWVPRGRTVQDPNNGGKKGENITSGYLGEGQKTRTATSNAGEGHFEDEHGRKVEGLVQFRVKDFEISKGSDRENYFVSIEGTMFDKETGNQIRDEERARAEKLPISRLKSHSSQDYLMSGALLNGNDINIPP